MRTGLLASIGAAAVATAAHAQGDPGSLRVRAQLVVVDGRSPRVGEPFGLRIEAEHRPGAIALLPLSLSWPASLAERRSARRHERRNPDDDAVEVDRYDLELVAFEAGELTIPAIDLAFGDARAKTTPIAVVVESGLSDDERPIATSTRPQALAALERMASPDPDPAPVLVPDPRPAYAAVAILCLLVLAATLQRFGARRPARAAGVRAPPPPPPRPAHIVALERLEALRNADCLERGETKRFHVELSEILRVYVGARFEFDSVELTVAELVAALRARPAPGLHLVALQRLLDDADFVKFAKHAPSEADSRRALDSACAIVDRTRPDAEVSDAAR